ncbi:pilus assembly protein N-terminal domain-containing protein [Massilia violaceinigra]|uniref:Pilus assembly protein N-terminal domain-containing protein n=1 Tax=Massilia violaceinigra TaxID=2045208 RepID=A0ABY4AD37_9BURK|nr:pilus assembly protein N-terminal domain-containing protein [Massilia violaceinigra]UOD32705.1 pilus assembly protein N-terminal domain-containing protein [Massilia violaceinigra]
MNKHIRMATLCVATAGLVAAPCCATAAAGGSGSGNKHCKSVVVAPAVQVMLGKSSVIPLKAPAVRIVASGQRDGKQPAQAAPAAGGDAADADSVADIEVLLLSPMDLFLLGKKAGATSLILQDTSGVCTLRDIVVAIDPATLQAKLAELMPEETGIVVKSAENAIVLTGSVRDAGQLDEALRVAGAYGGGKRVLNLLRVSSPQQVMLEVKIAEVSKTLLDKFGIDFARMVASADGLGSRVISGILGGAPALAGSFSHAGPGAALGIVADAAVRGGNAGAGARLAAGARGATLFGVDAQKKDGLVRVLAEPNIMAISGQSASFLSGGKIFIPVAQAREAGGSTVTLEEKEFGVGLKFSPTVLGGSRINLKLVSEVSELAQSGSPFTTNGGVTSVLPSITTRRVDTTVQLNDGQSFAIAGLIRNNVTETLSRFPGLGDIPVLGALFRSTEFQKDQTELIFIITPRLVKPAGALAAPTDNHVPGDRADLIFMGKTEGKAEGKFAPANRK